MCVEVLCDDFRVITIRHSHSFGMSKITNTWQTAQPRSRVGRRAVPQANKLLGIEGVNNKRLANLCTIGICSAILACDFAINHERVILVDT